MRSKQLNLRSEAVEIRDYLRAEDKADYELSPALLQKLNRIERCKELIAEDKFMSEVVQELQADFGISQKQAYNIYHEADVVYGFRAIKVESLFSEIRRTKEMAILLQDVRAAANSDRNYLQAIAKLLGEKEEDVYKNLQPVEVEIGEFQDLTVTKDFSEEDLLAFAEQYRQKHLSKAMESIAEDIEHENVEGDGG